MKAILLPLLALSLLILPSGARAQKYDVDLRSNKVTFFRGRVDQMDLTVRDATHSLDHYEFLVEANGAEVAYDQGEPCNDCRERTLRLKILPGEKDGTITVWARKEGIVYAVNGTVFFTAKPPPTEPGPLVPTLTKLEHPIPFLLPSRQQKEVSSLTLDYPNQLMLRGTESFSVKVKIGIHQNGFIVPVEGDINLVSADARITRTGKDVFDVAALPGKSRCVFHISLNNIILEDHVSTVYPSEK